MRTTISNSFVFAFCLLFTQNKVTKGLPNLSETSQEPIVAKFGDETFVDCKVKDIGNYTVLWRFVNPAKSTPSGEGEVLSAGKLRVTTDSRFSVLHHEDKDLWVLRIEEVDETDSGIYICEVNTIPRRRVARILSVVDDELDNVTSILEVDHNYTDCCAAEKVPSDCFNFCHFKSLVSDRQPTATFQKCVKHLSSITKCLTDGRDHMPCCVKQNVPKACRPVCVGNFSLTSVADHFECMDYAAPMLACIAEGVQTLPPQPNNVVVEPISSTELLLKWNISSKYKHLIDGFHVNVTQMHSFDETGITAMDDNKTSDGSETPSLYGLQMRFKVLPNATEFRITGLKKYTMYEIVMNSFNKIGTSLPTNTIRSLTLAEEDSKEAATKPKDLPQPKLPDIKKCCENGGVTLGRCVDVLCDPVRADDVTVTDLMICAPWANVTFKCMATGADHSKCCKKRGVSENCMPFCAGKLDRLDFRHFVCLDYMSTFTSCTLEHNGVIPSSPDKFMVSVVHNDWAILKWRPPKKLAHTVLEYHVHWRESAKDTNDGYKVEKAMKSPFLLHGLIPDKRYEVYVSAVSKYGVSESSPRILFSTPPMTAPEDIETEQKFPSYNETACCQRANMKPRCLPLCSYKVKVDDILSLAGHCADTLQTIIRCGAGGRNHVPCCRRRSVNNRCLNLCAGLIDTSPFNVATHCVEDLGKIIQCMEEGTGLLPGMPTEFHATLVTKDSVHLKWKPAMEDGESPANLYQVRYGEAETNTPLHPLEHDKSQNSTENKTVISGLKPATLYSFYVVAANSYGISLPSLVLLINTSSSENKSQIVHSNIGPPHAIEVIRQNVDSITFRWLPPLFVPPDSSISYIVHYKAINGTEADIIPGVTERWISVETAYNTMIITNLTYNTEYAITIQSKTNKNVTSAFSEMALVWTDPAIPASVNLPVIIPAGPIVEGSEITIMCVAMGIPTPSVSMYINGVLRKKAERRHVTLTSTVYRNLTSVTCLAVNGYGKDARSSQSTMEVRVRYKPVVLPYPSITFAHEEGPARIQCEVSGFPQPVVTWSKEDTNMHHVRESSNVNFITVEHSELPSTWIYTLLIRNTSSTDFGNYTCVAANDQGENNTTIVLEKDERTHYTRNATACCVEQGVSPKCLPSCTLDVNIEKALTIPTCYQDLDKLMKCAADGSDHRQCCRKKKVHAGCLRWCAGLKLSMSLCALSSIKEIISCFDEGKILLPGPPKDVHVKDSPTENKVIVEWSPPDKNPELVEWYRVFWRPVGSRDLNLNETHGLSFEISNLEPDKMYEFVVKSGNHYGLSTFTDPLVIPSHTWIAESTTIGSRLLKVFFGVLIVISLIVAGILAFFYAYKYYYLPKKTQNNGVSFENPSYMKDGTVQIRDSPTRSNGDVEFRNRDKNMNGGMETYS